MWPWLLAAPLLLPVIAEAGSAEEERQGGVTVSFHEGLATLRVSPLAGSRLGLETAVLERETRAPEREHQAVAVTADVLLGALTEGEALAERRASLGAVARAHRARLAWLVEARASGAPVDPGEAYRVELALTDATTASRNVARQARELATRLRLLWGESLLAALAADGERRRQALARGELALLRIALPPGLAPGDLPPEVPVAANGARGEALTAEVVGAAPTTEAWAGANAWALGPGQPFPAGMRLSVWVPETGGTPGYVLPAAATFWARGQRWVFLREGEVEGASLYVRHPVEASTLPEGSLFSTSPLPAGAALVVRGGHALLAEELRWSIPEEDDD